MITEVFATGCFLTPVETKDPEGNPVWVWVVTRFEDDTYNDGGCVNPVASAATREGLITAEED